MKINRVVCEFTNTKYRIMMNWPTILTLGIVLSTLINVNCELVKLNDGIINGTVGLSKNGRLFQTFLAIPFAEPPVGELRFKVPVPAKPWTGIKDCSNPSPKCVQFGESFRVSSSSQGQEDCLYLNVFVPNDLFKPDGKTPVIVGIHGGAFCAGDAIDYNPEYFMDKDIILVTVNYRMGVLGFFGLNNDQISGNFGLKDQSLALRWVKDNINKFGGDPNNVTLLGESAGAASVHLHMFSPLSKGLFQRAIVQSGSAFPVWANFKTVEYGEAISKAFLVSVNCYRENASEILTCLQRIPMNELYNFYNRFTNLFSTGIVFKSITETKVKNQPFLPRKPSKNTYVANVPWIYGINRGEGVLFALSYLKNETLLEVVNSNRKRMIPLMDQYADTVKPENIDNITQNIIDFYFGTRNISLDTALNFTNMLTDAMFMYPFARTVRSKSETQFLYLYDHRGSFSCQNWLNLTVNLGPCHADELPMLFRNKNLESKFTQQDKNVSKTLLNFWTNFAIFGDPNGRQDKKIWKSATKHNLQYLHIMSESVKMKKQIFYQRYKFWKSLHTGWNY